MNLVYIVNIMHIACPIILMIIINLKFVTEWNSL
jgi:hypothetical protein